MSSKHEERRLAAIVRRFSRRRITVVGDAIADQFVYGEICRVSREAPVFILRHEHTETTPGGAANCAANLAALGAQAALIAVVGKDPAGDALLGKLREASVVCDRVITATKRLTTTKVRVLAGQIHSTRQQVIRIDYDSEPGLDPSLHDQLRRGVREHAKEADCVIISDYNYGVAEPETGELVREVTRERDIPVLIDSRFRLSGFHGFTSATPNEDEVEQLLGKKHAEVSDLAAAAEDLRRRLGYRALLVTRGSQGMMLLEDGTPALHIAAVGAREAVDVTGAGDSVMATYALALASGASFADAARLANFAGGIVVMKRGTATVNQEELLHVINTSA
jgi:rfaE bifunctional protein kinase chain/domain